jgi:hypothetical protein
MSYTKINKETSTYVKTDKTQDKGHLKAPWFYDWFAGELYHKVSKVLSTFTKTDKNIASYTKTEKETAIYTKVNKE